MKFQRILLAAALAAVVAAGCRAGRPSSSSRGAGAGGAAPAKAQPAVVQKQPVEAHGLYLTGWSAGLHKKMTNIVNMMKQAGLNAVVVDVKDSDGAITFPMENKWAKQVVAKQGKVKQIADHGYAARCRNIDWTMNLLKENNIYPIARIAVFSDDCLPRVRPDMAVQTASGGLWRNKKGDTWLNPCSQEVWDYQVAVATEAIKKGFKEIQWDYVRFPTDGALTNMRFPGKKEGQSDADVIEAFLKYTRSKIEPQGAFISADIFGLTSLVKGDMGIGQVINRVANNVDYICPMVYPSHFHKGEYGIANPDQVPYKTVNVSLRDAKARLSGMNCKIRPWLQNFSLPDRGRYGGSHYGPEQIAAQIKGARDNGIGEFLMWDPQNRFEGLAAAMAKLAKEPAKSALAPADKAAGPAPAPAKAAPAATKH